MNDGRWCFELITNCQLGITNWLLVIGYWVLVFGCPDSVYFPFGVVFFWLFKIRNCQIPIHNS